MLTAAHIETALKAAGAGWSLVMPAADIAKAFNDAILTYGGGLFKTTNSVAALVSESMMESAYFRTTEEYSKTTGDYQPYRGRTFIQITWKSNYEKFGTWCFSKGLVTDPLIFVKNPEMLADRRWAAIGPVWYFTQVMFHGKPLVDYTDNIDQVGKAVNMGDPFSKSTPNGHAARFAAFKAVSALGSSIIPVPEEPIIEPPKPPKEPDVTSHYSSKWKIHYVRWRNGNVALVTKAVCLAIPSPVYLSQGGLSSSVAASANTHAGIGAYDISVKNWNKKKIETLCKELIRSGEYAFPRGGWWRTGMFVTHVHVVSGNVPRSALHPEARAQLDDFKAGRNGLANNGRYVGPKVPRGTWKTSPYNPANIKDGNNVVYYVDIAPGSKLIANNIDRKPKSFTRKRGDKLRADKLVYRWGRWNLVTKYGTYYALSELTTEKVTA